MDEWMGGLRDGLVDGGLMWWVRGKRDRWIDHGWR